MALSTVVWWPLEGTVNSLLVTLYLNKFSYTPQNSLKCENERVFWLDKTDSQVGGLAKGLDAKGARQKSITQGHLVCKKSITQGHELKHWNICSHKVHGRSQSQLGDGDLLLFVVPRHSLLFVVPPHSLVSSHFDVFSWLTCQRQQQQAPLPPCRFQG